MTPRPLIWVLTESPISIFPALRNEDRKQKVLGAYYLRVLQKRLGWIMIRSYASLEGWSRNCLLWKHFSVFSKSTIEHATAGWITQGLTCGSGKQPSAEVRVWGKTLTSADWLLFPNSRMWCGLPRALTTENHNKLQGLSKRAGRVQTHTVFTVVFSR